MGESLETQVIFLFIQYPSSSIPLGISKFETHSPYVPSLVTSFVVWWSDISCSWEVNRIYTYFKTFAKEEYCSSTCKSTVNFTFTHCSSIHDTGIPFYFSLFSLCFCLFWSSSFRCSAFTSPLLLSVSNFYSVWFWSANCIVISVFVLYNLSCTENMQIVGNNHIVMVNQKLVLL